MGKHDAESVARKGYECRDECYLVKVSKPTGQAGNYQWQQISHVEATRNLRQVLLVRTSLLDPSMFCILHYFLLPIGGLLPPTVLMHESDVNIFTAAVD